MRYLFLLTVFFPLPQLHASPLLNGFTAEYEVFYNDTFLGVSKRRLVTREHGKKLDYAATTIPKGLLAFFFSDQYMEHSLIEKTPEGLRPVQYDYQQTGGKTNSTFQAKFDWQKGIITMTDREQAVDLIKGSQDLLSFQLAIIDGLQKGKQYFSFHVVDHKRVRLQKLKYSLTVKMPSSIGEIDVIKLDHVDSKTDYHFNFWCAKQLNFIPILIRKTKQNGKITELRLKSFNSENFSIPGGDAQEDEF